MEEELARLKSEGKPDMNYLLHPADVIDEEDLEESTGQLSALKKQHTTRNSQLSQSIQSLNKKLLSPNLQSRKAAELSGTESKLASVQKPTESFKTKEAETTVNNFVQEA